MSTHNTWGKNKTEQKATSAKQTLPSPSHVTLLGDGEVLGNSKRAYP